MARGMVVLAAVVALLLAGCRLDATTDVTVAADGSGSLEVAVELDRATADTITAGGTSLVPSVPAPWEADETIDDDVHRVVLRTTFADPDGLATRVRDLQAGLDDEDPALLESLDLTMAPDGAARLAGRAGLRLPSSAGARAQGWPDAEELVDLARGGDVTATLRAHFPGEVADGNATAVDGRTATWSLPVGEMAAIEAAAAAPPPWRREVLAWAAIAGIVVLVVLVSWWWRRRRRERTAAPMGRVQRMRSPY